MNRRTSLTGATLTGAALTGASATLAALAPEPASAAKTGDAARAADSPNLNPPVVQAASGKLHGFRDGKTSLFPLASGPKAKAVRSARLSSRPYYGPSLALLPGG